MIASKTTKRPAKRVAQGRTSRAAARAIARNETGLPSTMRAAVVDRFGPPSVLRLRTLPVPDVGPDEILIAVWAAGVGIWDAKIRDGTWAEGRARFPLVLGTDGAGVVAARGARVRRFEVGDRVWAYQYQNPKGGFYSEYVAVAARSAALVPAPLEFEEAAAACVTGLTALQGIDEHLAVRAGQSVLVFGAAGAVGTLAVQFAKRTGARVLAVASGRDGVALTRRLGADVVIDGRRDVDGLSQLAPEGLDAVLALAGGEGLERCLALVRPGGRVAYPNGVEPEPRRRPKLRVVAYDAVADPRAFSRLERAVEEARLQVPIAAAYPIARAAKAHERMEKGHVLGRIVVRIRSEARRRGQGAARPGRKASTS
jgi:NADPH2:quinone reductase